MTKSDIAARVAAKLSIPKATADASVSALFDVIGDTQAKGEPVSIAGFGTFSVKDRAARQGRNPRTGETIVIAASKVASFKAGKGLRDALRYPTHPASANSTVAAIDVTSRAIESDLDL